MNKTVQQHVKKLTKEIEKLSRICIHDQTMHHYSKEILKYLKKINYKNEQHETE